MTVGLIAAACCVGYCLVGVWVAVWAWMSAVEERDRHSCKWFDLPPGVRPDPGVPERGRTHARCWCSLPNPEQRALLGVIWPIGVWVLLVFTMVARRQADRAVLAERRRELAEAMEELEP